MGPTVLQRRQEQWGRRWRGQDTRGLQSWAEEATCGPRGQPRKLGKSRWGRVIRARRSLFPDTGEPEVRLRAVTPCMRSNTGAPRLGSKRRWGLPAVTSGSSIPSGQGFRDSVKTRINYHEPGGGAAGAVTVRRAPCGTDSVERRQTPVVGAGREGRGRQEPREARNLPCGPCGTLRPRGKDGVSRERSSSRCPATIENKIGSQPHTTHRKQLQLGQSGLREGQRDNWGFSDTVCNMRNGP